MNCESSLDEMFNDPVESISAELALGLDMEERSKSRSLGFSARLSRAGGGRPTPRGDGDPDLIVQQDIYYSPKYVQTFRRSLEDPEAFWAEVAECVTWDKPWKKVLDNSQEPFTKWFVGGELNACYNAVDRHVEAGRGDKYALIHDSPVTNTKRHVTYSELLHMTSHMAGALSALGVGRGDRVIIFMPLIPEAVVSMLATARLGAVHSVVFGGFAARELAIRIDHVRPAVIVAASAGVEPNKVIRYKSILEEALAQCTYGPSKVIMYQRRNVATVSLESPRYLDWDEVMANARPHPPVPVEANDPLYILYTSGTTDSPKGIQRSVGGHIATLAWTMSTLYNVKQDDVMWTASDMGWVVGHSYICYGPLVYGMTSVMYEGKPDRTPDAGSYFRVIQDHKVNVIFTAPTALRVIRKVDPEVTCGRKYSTKSLRAIFVAGEHCDFDTKKWAGNVFQVPILNHWWQTETGHAVTATALGLGHHTNPPPFSAGMPFPGYDVQVLRPDGSRAAPNEHGRLAVKLPLPPGTLATLYKAPERFEQTYFTRYPGYYDTMDAGFIDENGYVYVTARDDDVINVAGHRLSTSALEDVVMSHPLVRDAVVVGVPDPTKGEIPLCLFEVDPECSLEAQEDLRRELVEQVRALVGPIAAFRLVAPVPKLPRTRSGKLLRRSITQIAKNKFVKIPATIEDPTIFHDIKAVLQKLGYAKTAPDPQ